MSVTDYALNDPAVRAAHSVREDVRRTYKLAGLVLDESECDCKGPRCRKVCAEYRAEQAHEDANYALMRAELAWNRAMNSAILRYC